jgi:protein arginine kinase activator
MLCQKCHKNLATVRYAEVVDGKVANVHLCPDCLAKQQEEAAGFELSGKAPEPSAFFRAQEKQARPVAQRTCPSCGMRLREALRRERFGCRQCYEAFGEGVESRLGEVHGVEGPGRLKHRGKRPGIDAGRERLRTELQTKRSLLRSALKTENYEEAAVLRDVIKGLEDQLAGRMATMGQPVAGGRGREQ